ncbi:hypothetical protein GW17_00058589 [Ensete ventricosum]|nr:hypothetical protein GW17_00058589 [Ensete ventricosum]
MPRPRPTRSPPAGFPKSGVGQHVDAWVGQHVRTVSQAETSRDREIKRGDSRVANGRAPQGGRLAVAMDDLGWGSRFPSYLDARDRSSNAVKRDLPEDAGPRLFCDACGGVEFDSGDDGFYYCRLCGSQSQDVVDTGYAEEDVFGDAQGSGALYHIHRHRAQKHSQDPAAPAISKDDVLRSLSKSLAAGSGGVVKKEQEKELPYGFEDQPSEPRDFGAGPCLDAETLARGIRLRYVQGLQVILQLQCEALVEKFGVSPLICGLAGTIWLRYVASSMVFDEGWGQKVIAESEATVSQSRDDNPGKDLFHLYASISLE